jgi:hypothetical protein
MLAPNRIDKVAPAVTGPVITGHWPPHSMTSSAMASSDGSVLAASNLVGCYNDSEVPPAAKPDF